jgi:hypothetical protein
MSAESSAPQVAAKSGVIWPNIAFDPGHVPVGEPLS